MTSTWSLSSWVEAQQERIGFALQVFPVDTAEDPVGRMLSAGRLAERLGFDGFFFGDHPAWGPECWVHMANLAATTERIRLGTGVVCALYRHPVMTARLVALISITSAGDGSSSDSAVAGPATVSANLGLPFPPVATRQAALEEAIVIMRGVWGEGCSCSRPSIFRRRYPGDTPAPSATELTPPLAGAASVHPRQAAQSVTPASWIVRTDKRLNIERRHRRKLAVLRQHRDELGRPRPCSGHTPPAGCC